MTSPSFGYLFLLPPPPFLLSLKHCSLDALAFENVSEHPSTRQTLSVFIHPVKNDAFDSEKLALPCAPPWREHCHVSLQFQSYVTASWERIIDPQRLFNKNNNKRLERWRSRGNLKAHSNVRAMCAPAVPVHRSRLWLLIPIADKSPLLWLSFWRLWKLG